MNFGKDEQLTVFAELNTTELKDFEDEVRFQVISITLNIQNDVRYI